MITATTQAKKPKHIGTPFFGLAWGMIRLRCGDGSLPIRRSIKAAGIPGTTTDHRAPRPSRSRAWMNDPVVIDRKDIMKNQNGVIEWMLLIKILLVAITAGASAYYGADLLPTTTKPVEPAVVVHIEEVVHSGIVQAIEPGFNSKLITFDDGTKVVIPKECDAFVGIKLKILSGIDGMHCEWIQ
jgi:hypothetical protein